MSAERHYQTEDSRPDRRDPKTRVLLNNLDLIDLGGLGSLSITQPVGRRLMLFLLFLNEKKVRYW